MFEHQNKEFKEKFKKLHVFFIYNNMNIKKAFGS